MGTITIWNVDGADGLMLKVQAYILTTSADRAAAEKLVREWVKKDFSRQHPKLILNEVVTLDCPHGEEPCAACQARAWQFVKANHKTPMGPYIPSWLEQAGTDPNVRIYGYKSFQ